MLRGHVSALLQSVQKDGEKERYRVRRGDRKQEVEKGNEEKRKDREEEEG